MRLATRTVNEVAEMICGDHDAFPYRSSSYLTEFLSNCDMDYRHDGSTRKRWVASVLEELNEGAASDPTLPPDGVVRVIQELMDPVDFDRRMKDRAVALEHLNKVLSRDGVQAFLDGAGRSHIRSLGGEATSAGLQLQKPTWSKEELRRREAVAQFLDRASEDELIESILVPLFSRLGFRRVSAAGHKDKALEYGTDLWMKYQLPTGHLLYFGLQAKRGKLDAAGRSKNENVSEMLNQVRMMLDHPVFDPDANKRVLLDHVFVACGGEITKQAKNWLAHKLDADGRRRIIFMDREEIVGLCIGVNLSIPMGKADDDLPF
jgi:hypothetical protein